MQSNQSDQFHKTFSWNTCAAAGIEIPRKKKKQTKTKKLLRAWFQGNNLHSDLHFLNAQVIWYK